MKPVYKNSNRPPKVGDVVFIKNVGDVGVDVDVIGAILRITSENVNDLSDIGPHQPHLIRSQDGTLYPDNDDTELECLNCFQLNEIKHRSKGSTFKCWDCGTPITYDGTRTNNHKATCYD